MIAKIEGIPKQVTTIVAQHHEQFGGSGYPKGMRGEDIYDLAKIVSMANIFDHTLQDNKDKPSQRYKLAIKVLEYDRGKQFDPEFIPRIVEGLKIAYIELTNSLLEFSLNKWYILIKIMLTCEIRASRQP